MRLRLKFYQNTTAQSTPTSSYMSRRSNASENVQQKSRNPRQYSPTRWTTSANYHPQKKSRIAYAQGSILKLLGFNSHRRLSLCMCVWYAAIKSMCEICRCLAVWPKIFTALIFGADIGYFQRPSPRNISCITSPFCENGVQGRQFSLL